MVKRYTNVREIFLKDKTLFFLQQIQIVKGKFQKKKNKNQEQEEEQEENFDFVFDSITLEEEQSRKKNKIEKEDINQDPFIGETPEEKRIRLAKEYIRTEMLKTEAADAGEMDKDIIAQRLKQDALESKPRYQKQLAEQLRGKKIDINSIKNRRGHQLSVTCIVISSDEKIIYSGSKDCTIIKWDAETGKKIYQYPGSYKSKKGIEGHIGEVLSIAISSDGKYLASGGKDRFVRIWDTQSNKLLDSFKGHRDKITALSFRVGSHQLFSGSNDRTIKIWDIDEMMYVDTLYGHQSEITSLDCLRKERPVTSSRDKTAHVWKVVEETQLVFRGHSGSVDCVSQINEDNFITGSEDGSIALWNTQKKRPTSLLKRAHTEKSNNLVNWITSVAACKNSNLVASGSSDGLIRLWKADLCGQLSEVLSIPVIGFVNCLGFANTGQFLVAAIGQEHKFGRWTRIKEAKNGIRIIPLQKILEINNNSF